MICLEEFLNSELSLRKSEVKKVSECDSPVLVGHHDGEQELGGSGSNSHASHIRES